MDFKTNEKIRYIGRLLMPSIFDGEHSFSITDNGDSTSTLHHSERFKGILVPFFKKKLKTDVQAGFEAVNQALKVRVEARVAKGEMVGKHRCSSLHFLFHKKSDGMAWAAPSLFSY